MTPAECGDDDGTNRYAGVCDKDGCDFNSYRMGNATFYGKGKTIDTSKPVTVVTQFLTTDGTAAGDLSEIKRFYVQGGKVVPNSMSTVAGVPQNTNSITPGFCTAQKTAFANEDHFSKLGGLKAMGDAMGRGMVLVMSLWDDHAANALWLDSSYPADADPTKPGVKRGECATTSGVPAEVEANAADSTVVFSNIKVGDIGSTFAAPPAAAAAPPAGAAGVAPPVAPPAGAVPPVAAPPAAIPPVAAPPVAAPPVAAPPAVSAIPFVA